MQQVPYGIIGAGRMARHFGYYLSQLDIPFLQWSRSQPMAGITTLVQGSERIVILINDNAIEAFVESHPILKTKPLIHFSGQLHTPLATGAHPLLSFGMDIYPLQVYQQMPFILEDTAFTFSELFPGLANPHYFIAAAQKSLYHSLCVLSGNFTVLLWQKFFKELPQTLGIPADAGQLYMQQIFSNLQQNPSQALTGPLTRDDQATIAANLDALAGDTYQPVYQAFVNAFYGEKKNECR